ncbi:MAG: efflux RND transporter periplasmic adaptor subunit [Anditalea sp.]
MKYQSLSKSIGFLLLMALGIAGCGTDGKPLEEKTQETTEVAVATAKVTKQIASYTLQLPGELAPFEEVQLYPKVSGFVQKLYVDRGSQVQKGQLLARLEAPEITQQYMAASARQREVVERLQFSQQAYKRLKEASKSSGAVAAIELEQAQAKLMGDSASYMSLNAEMAAAQQLASYMDIRAPFAGIVTSRSVSQGALVGAGDKPLFTLAQQDRLRLTIAIPEKHARSLSDSTSIRFRLSNFPDEAFTAQISRSSGVLDKSLRSLMVEFDVPNEDHMLSGGEYVQAEVQFRRPIASLWVPASSLLHTATGIFVLKVEDGMVQRVAVKEGIRQDKLAEVFGPLKEDEQIIVNGSEEIREGSQIVVKQ